jgi:hypothetical protein
MEQRQLEAMSELSRIEQRQLQAMSAQYPAQYLHNICTISIQYSAQYLRNFCAISAQYPAQYLHNTEHNICTIPSIIPSIISAQYPAQYLHNTQYNVCTVPSIKSKTKDTSRLSAHNKQFSRQAMRSEPLRTARSRQTQRDFTDTVDWRF